MTEMLEILVTDKDFKEAIIKKCSKRKSNTRNEWCDRQNLTAVHNFLP